VLLSEHWQRFVAEQVRSGRFPSEAAVLEKALALLKQQERPLPLSLTITIINTPRPMIPLPQVGQGGRFSVPQTSEVAPG
jgi:hypothetical protein